MLFFITLHLAIPILFKDAMSNMDEACFSLFCNLLLEDKCGSFEYFNRIILVLTDYKED